MKRTALSGHPGTGSRIAAKYLRRAVGRIVRRFRPEKIVLFGSHAYGEPGAGSDLDLLVVLRSTRHPFEQESSVDVLLADRPVPMDILVRTPDELAEYRRTADPFWLRILEEGKILYAARG